MQTEKIAIIVLAVIVVGALTTFLVLSYYGDIFENLFGGNGGTVETGAIELGDCADVNYIGRYASNNTIFDSSYNDTINKTGGSPLQVFVSTNSSENPFKDGYNSVIEGFAEGLVGLKEGETKTIGPIPPEKAYGVTPKVGDVLDFSALTGTNVSLKLLEVQKDVPMPEEYISYLGEGNTTLYLFRDESHYIGEPIDNYLDNSYKPYWKNATVVTKINDTLIWHYTTPTEGEYENLTWVDTNLEEQYTIIYPENVSAVTLVTDTEFVITVTPEVDDIITYYDNENPSGLAYIVDNITDDTIKTYVDDGSPVENRTYKDYDRTITYQRNKTTNITQPIPSAYLEMLLSYLRSLDSSIIYSMEELADQTLYYEVEVVKVYKSSQEES